MNNQLYDPRQAQTSSFMPQDLPSYPFGGGGYSGGYPGGGFAGGGQLPVPYGGQQQLQKPGGGFNFGDIKAAVDRMGGIDGIVGMMGKFNKIMGTVQQMAPMLKLFFGSFGAKAASRAKDKGSNPLKRSRRRRTSRRRRRR